MQLIDGRIRLTDLANAFGVSTGAMRQHMKNRSGLSDNAVKMGATQTSDWLLSIDSVLNFIFWSRSNGKKLTMETLDRVEGEVKWLKAQQ